MSDIAVRKYYTDWTKARSDLHIALVNSGWQFWDEIGDEYDRVYRSNGEQGIYPYVYIEISGDTYNLYISLWLYWNNSTHTGTCETGAPGMYISFSADGFFHFAGNKDVWAIMEEDGLKSHGWGFCTELIHTNITRTTIDEVAGDMVSLLVSSSSGIVKGQRIQIVGINYEGRDQLQVMSIPDSTHITILNLPRDYASGAFVGVTPCPAFITSYWLNSGYCLCGHNMVGDETGTHANSYANVLSTIADLYVNPDESSGLYTLTPYYITSTYGDDFLIGYIDNKLLKYCAATTVGQIFAITTGISEQGAVTSATSISVSTSTKSWTINEWTNKRLVIEGGTGADQTVNITSNTSDTLIVDYAFSVTPDATSTYRIVDTAYRNMVSNGFVFLEGDLGI